VEERIRGGSLQPVVVLPSVHAGRVGVLDDPRVLKNLVEWRSRCAEFLTSICVQKLMRFRDMTI
jgi:hypothetical protein